MQVLERNIGWHRDVVCTGYGSAINGCGSKLRIEREDLRYQPGDLVEDSKVYFTCCVCGVVSALGTNDWPKNATHLYPNRRDYEFTPSPASDAVTKSYVDQTIADKEIT